MLLMAFRLASHLHRPVSELRMTMQEFYTWVAYLELEPPDAADNVRTAALMAQVTNMAGRSLPGKKTVSAKDFLPKPKPKPQTREEQIAFLKGIKHGS